MSYFSLILSNQIVIINGQDSNSLLCFLHSYVFSSNLLRILKLHILQRPICPSPILGCHRMALFAHWKLIFILSLVENSRWNIGDVLNQSTFTYRSRYFSAFKNVSKKICWSLQFFKSASEIHLLSAGETKSMIKQRQSRNGSGSTPRPRKRVSLN